MCVWYVCGCVSGMFEVCVICVWCVWYVCVCGMCIVCGMCVWYTYVCDMSVVCVYVGVWYMYVCGPPGLTKHQRGKCWEGVHILH